jgi:hypothetical protein
MKSALNEVKKELLNLDQPQLVDLCVRLAKYKKENKELLGYLLFESHDEDEFIQKVKLEVDEQFNEINKNNLYWVKKSLRKILKNVSKYIRYSGIKQTEIELIIYYCFKIKESKIPIHSSAVLTNLYYQQIKKVRKILETLHEDLRYDYELELEKL